MCKKETARGREFEKKWNVIVTRRDGVELH